MRCHFGIQSQTSQTVIFSKQLIENEATKPQQPPPRAGRLRATAVALENSQPAEGATAATQQVHHAAPRVTSQVSKER